MKLIMPFILLTILSACADVPEGEMERMRASLPREQDPPASYGQRGMGVP